MLFRSQPRGWQRENSAGNHYHHRCHRYQSININSRFNDECGQHKYGFNGNHQYVYEQNQYGQNIYGHLQT